MEEERVYKNVRLMPNGKMVSFISGAPKTCFEDDPELTYRFGRKTMSHTPRGIYCFSSLATAQWMCKDPGHVKLKPVGEPITIEVKPIGGKMPGASAYNGSVNYIAVIPIQEVRRKEPDQW